MKLNGPITLCLKNCGINVTTPLTVAEGLHGIILLPSHKLELLNDYCKETGNVNTLVLQRIVSD